MDDPDNRAAYDQRQKAREKAVFKAALKRIDKEAAELAATTGDQGTGA
ncbi:hypothetical protein ABZW30_44235 [Kitasatospora sp. NPDC004669]